MKWFRENKHWLLVAVVVVVLLVVGERNRQRQSAFENCEGARGDYPEYQACLNRAGLDIHGNRIR